SGDVLLLAIGRASEISIGIVCAGLVLSATDFGNARRRLAVGVASLASEISARFSRTFLQPRSELAKTREIRRDLLLRVAGLDPVSDETIGESSELRYHSPVLHAIVSGLFSALAAWRGIAIHLESGGCDRHDAETIRNLLPEELRGLPVEGEAESWAADPERV